MFSTTTRTTSSPTPEGVRHSGGSGGAGNRTQTSRLKVCSPTFGPRPRAAPLYRWMTLSLARLPSEQRGNICSHMGPADPTRRSTGRPAGGGAKPVQLRRCDRHGDVEFALYGRRYPRWRCKRCVTEAVGRRKRRVRRILIEAAGGRCAVCGYDRCTANLHFHHVDPARKQLELSSHRGVSLAAFLEERKKCVLLCANCHGEVEAGLIRSPPPDTIYEARD